MNWGFELRSWLVGRGYELVEKGPINPVTGHGWYSHPAEYRRGHVRVRINDGGIIILRDPGCTIELTRGHEQWSPNAGRVDFPGFGRTLADLQAAITSFEARPAYSLEEAREVCGLGHLNA